MHCTETLTVAMMKVQRMRYVHDCDGDGNEDDDGGDNDHDNSDGIMMISVHILHVSISHRLQCFEDTSAKRDGSVQLEHSLWKARLCMTECGHLTDV